MCLNKFSFTEFILLIFLIEYLLFSYCFLFINFLIFFVFVYWFWYNILFIILFLSFRSGFIKTITASSSYHRNLHNIFYLPKLVFASAKLFLFRLILPKDFNDPYISSLRLVVPLLLPNGLIVISWTMHYRIAKRG